MTIAATTPTDTGGAIEWVLPSVFLLRVGGLPMGAADELSFPDSTAWAERTLDMEDRLRREAEEVADRLQRTVADHQDDRDVRRDLLNVRRDVFNLREPDRRALDRLAAALDPSIVEALGRWLHRWAGYAEEAAAGAGVLDRELAARRQHLRLLANEPDLRFGILLSSPSLDQFLPTYLEAAEPRLSKRARRLERTLLEYLFRAACKTSPFSTFTTVSLGTFVSGAGAPVRLDAPASRKLSSTRLNMALLARLSALVLADDAKRADLPVTAPAGWQVLG